MGAKSPHHEGRYVGAIRLDSTFLERGDRADSSRNSAPQHQTPQRRPVCSGKWPFLGSQRDSLPMSAVSLSPEYTKSRGRIYRNPRVRDRNRPRLHQKPAPRGRNPGGNHGENGPGAPVFGTREGRFRYKRARISVPTPPKTPPSVCFSARGGGPNRRSGRAAGDHESPPESAGLFDDLSPHVVDLAKSTGTA